MPGTYKSPVESRLYYLNARYYGPEARRFVNVDDVSLLTASATGLTDKNLFAYCDDNPVVRKDNTGVFWETAFDVISLGASIVEVCVNLTDPWAWAGLAGDAVDLIPFITGVGEMTRAVKTTVKVVDKAGDFIVTAKSVYKMADAASDIRKATGSYELLFESGKNYAGKGGFKRAMDSAKRISTNEVDKVKAIYWKSAPNVRQAFIDDFFVQKKWIDSGKKGKTYNKIWSPGRRYFLGK